MCPKRFLKEVPPKLGYPNLSEILTLKKGKIEVLPEVLKEIERHPILSVNNLSEILGLNKPLLSNLLQSLLRRGYLKRQKVTSTPEKCQKQSCPFKGTCPIAVPSKRNNQETQPAYYSLTTKGKKMLNKRKGVSNNARL